MSFLHLPEDPPISPGKFLRGCYGESVTVLKQSTAAAQE